MSRELEGWEGKLSGDKWLGEIIDIIRSLSAEDVDAIWEAGMDYVGSARHPSLYHGGVDRFKQELILRFAERACSPEQQVVSPESSLNPIGGQP